MAGKQNKQMKKNEQKSFLSTAEAAAVLGLKESTMRVWRSQGKGPGYYRVGSAVRYKMDDLEAWIATNCEHVVPMN